MYVLGLFNKNTEEIDELVQLAVDRASNLYDKHRRCCSESLLVVMNQAFGGGLSAEAALQIGSGFCHGMGGACSTCGVLTGGVAGLGLFLGPHSKDGLRKKKFDKIVRKLHDQFRGKNGSTSCQVLTEKVKRNRKARHANCLDLTNGGAELAVRLLLEARPELIKNADRDFLLSRDNVK